MKFGDKMSKVSSPQSSGTQVPPIVCFVSCPILFNIWLFLPCPDQEGKRGKERPMSFL
jgi:hypothetical protein